MSYSLSELKPGTLAARYDGQLVIITEHKLSNPKYPVIYKTKAESKSWKGSLADIKTVLGSVDLDAFITSIGATAPSPSRHTGTDNDFLVPDILKGVKVGDSIVIRGRGGNETVTYDGYNRNRPKYPVSFSRNGRAMKAPMSMVVGPVAGTPPLTKNGGLATRNDAEIIMDIAIVYGDLSPENLTCDGELPRGRVKAKAASLNRRLNRLFGELGRNISETEAYRLSA